MPLSIAFIMKFYKTIPDVVSSLYDENIITQKGINYINEYIFSKKIMSRYKFVKRMIYFLTVLLSVVGMSYLFMDDLSGWGDPEKSITIAAIVLLVIPLALFYMFHISFIFDQLCLGIMIKKLCHTDYISTKIYHPDKHFGLEPLSRITNISLYIGIICCIMYLVTFATSLSIHGLGYLQTIPILAFFLPFLIIIVMIILFPLIPIYGFLSAEKNEELRKIRVAVSLFLSDYNSGFCDKYQALCDASSIIIGKKSFITYLITMSMSLLPSAVSTVIKFKLIKITMY